MPNLLARLNPLRSAMLASAIFLVVVLLLTLYAPVALADPAGMLLRPGAFLCSAVGLASGFVATVLSFYVNFAVYTALFAVVLRFWRSCAR